MRAWSVLRCGRATEPPPLPTRFGYRPQCNWNACKVENVPCAHGKSTFTDLHTYPAELDEVDNVYTAHSRLARRKERYNNERNGQMPKDKSTESPNIYSRRPLRKNHDRNPKATQNQPNRAANLKFASNEYFAALQNPSSSDPQNDQQNPHHGFVRKEDWIGSEASAQNQEERLGLSRISESIPQEEAMIMRSGAHLDHNIMHAIYGDCDRKVEWQPRKELCDMCLGRAELSKRSRPGRRIIQRDGMFMTQSFYQEGLYHRYWRRNIEACIHGLLDREIPARKKWNSLKVQHWDTVEAWARAITENGNTLSAFFQAWQSVDVRERGERWPNIVLWLLLNQPRQALLFLRATNHYPGPPFKMVSDCFSVLYYHRYALFQTSESANSQFHRYLSYCLGPNKWPSILTSQRGLRLYLASRKDGEVATAFRKMLIQEAHISTPTLVTLVDRFVGLGDVDNALQAFILAHDHETRRTNFYYKEMTKRCRKLLTLDKVTTRDGVRGFEVLRTLLERGWRLDKRALNVVLTNAVRIGDHELAWEIYELMKSRHLSADSFTYVQLLHSAIQCGDGSKMQDILRIIKANPDMERRPHIVSKILHTIFSMFLSNSWSGSDTFNAMLHVYCQAHWEKPLLDLGIITESQTSPTQKEKTSPPKPSLTLMITAFVRSQSDPWIIRETFQRFQQLVLEGHRDIAPLAEDDFTYNAFIHAGVPHLDLLDDNVKIVETMLRPFPETAVIQSDPPRQVQHAGPTIQTWTILLSAFMTHKQPQTALKIRDMMMERGYKFNEVTWNVMIRGFARLQKVRETAASFKMMAREDFEPDEYTYQALDIVENQEELRSVLNWLDMEDTPIADAGPASADSDPEDSNEQGTEFYADKDSD